MPRNISRRSMLAMPAVFLLPASEVFAQAAAWRPSRLVTIVVPQGSGGTTDVMARLFASYIQTRWGQNVVVENKPGAGGVIGTQRALTADPDGHTILMGNVGAQAIAFSLTRNLPYKFDDMIPISNMITGPNVLIVNKSLPVNSLREFIDYMKSSPTKLNFGTPGVGSTPHLAALWFNVLTGADSTAVHYRGSAGAMTDLLSGTIQYSFDALVNAREQIRGSTVKTFGVTGAKRFPGMPDLPVLQDELPELKGLVSESWVGLFLQKGTPPEIVNALNQEARSFLSQPETPQRMLDLGGVPDYQTVEQFAPFVRRESEKWAEIVRSAKIQLDL